MGRILHSLGLVEIIVLREMSLKKGKSYLAEFWAYSTAEAKEHYAISRKDATKSKRPSQSDATFDVFAGVFKSQLLDFYTSVCFIP